MKLAVYCRTANVQRNAEATNPAPGTPPTITRSVSENVVLLAMPSQPGVVAANINLQFNCEATVGQFQDGKKYNVTIEEAV